MTLLKKIKEKSGSLQKEDYLYLFGLLSKFYFLLWFPVPKCPQQENIWWWGKTNYCCIYLSLQPIQSVPISKIEKVQLCHGR